jgi:Na+/H+ antiporter NhaD/arsenite permease-like protein
MDTITVGVFAATYLGMALGRFPGLKLDRTGIALLAAVALLVTGQIDVEDAGTSIDMSTLLLLFALMIVSTQFQEAGLYRLAAARVAAWPGDSRRIMLAVVAAAGLLSAVLANDIVVFAMTPILIEGIRMRGLDPRPFLLGLAGGANAGSAMTVIGNPQNILIGQVGGLDFWSFLLACGVPALASLAVVHATISWVWKDELTKPPQPPEPTAVPTPDPWQYAKGVSSIVFLLALFATDMPREVGALAVAALLLTSRRLASRDMLGAVDWHLLVLFACLFVVTDAFSTTSAASAIIEGLANAGWLPDRLTAMVPITLAGSNTIGNVPATMLILSMWPINDVGPLYGLALLSTLAGNLLLVGSLANIIVVERAANMGVRLSFVDFAKAGIPMTLASLALATLWLGLGGWMAW